MVWYSWCFVVVLIVEVMICSDWIRDRTFANWAKRLQLWWCPVIVNDDILHYDISSLSILRQSFCLCLECSKEHMSSNKLFRIAYVLDNSFDAWNDLETKPYCAVCKTQPDASCSYYIPQESDENKTGFAWGMNQIA